MNKKKIEDQLQDLKKNLQNRDVWTIFFGAGASKDAKYLTMVELCNTIIRNICNKEKKEQYECLILDLYNFRKDSNKVNIENILEDLFRLSSIKFNRKQIDISYPSVKNIDYILIEMAIKYIKKEVIESFKTTIPVISSTRDFIKYWFTGSRYMKIFTTNWDSIIEMSCDDLLDSSDLYIRCIDGFKGILNQKLDIDLYDEKITSDIHDYIHRLDLFKLHGSLDWILQGNTIKKIYNKETKDDDKVMIFPTPSKVQESLGFPYAELFRIFSNTILDINHCKYLLCIGASFPDVHINSIISQALKRKKEDFNLYIIDPNITLDQLHDTFGKSKAIQEPINIQFNQLVKYLTEDVLI